MEFDLKEISNQFQLDGDVYFRIYRENHNLDRARTQFKMAADMEEKWIR